MSTVVIILMILGLVFIFASFGIASKLDVAEEEGVIEIPDELSDDQKAKISNLVNDYMDEKIDLRLSDIEAKLAEIVNEKTLALGDYAVTVNEEIERNHNEVMFLYSMLSDKQQEIMTTANMVDEYKKDVKNIAIANEIKKEQEKETESVDENLAEAIKEIDEAIAESEEEVTPVDSSKDIILEMHKSGLSILEIAKHLGLGVGEVKLVVDLYQGEAK